MSDTNQSSTFYICDKCGSLGEKDARGVFDHTSLHIRGEQGLSAISVTSSGSPGGAYDLCCQCVSDMKSEADPMKPLFLALS